MNSSLAGCLHLDDEEDESMWRELFEERSRADNDDRLFLFSAESRFSPPLSSVKSTILDSLLVGLAARYSLAKSLSEYDTSIGSASFLTFICLRQTVFNLTISNLNKKILIYFLNKYLLNFILQKYVLK